MSSHRTPQERDRLIREHRDAIDRLETEDRESGPDEWPPQGFYLIWHLVVGITLGGLGALVSLAFNVIGAPLFGEPALKLIRVYLTFPMGARALEAGQGVLLFVGSLLYMITGAIYGILFHLMMRLGFREASAGKRFIVATVFGLGIWIFNFYLVLSWLQPMLLGDNWIVRMVPWWVAASTHLTFAWAMLLGESWGRFEPEQGRA